MSRSRTVLLLLEHASGGVQPYFSEIGPCQHLNTPSRTSCRIPRSVERSTRRCGLRKPSMLRAFRALPFAFATPHPSGRISRARYSVRAVRPAGAKLPARSDILPCVERTLAPADERRCQRRPLCRSLGSIASGAEPPIVGDTNLKELDALQDTPSTDDAARARPDQPDGPHGLRRGPVRTRHFHDLPRSPRRVKEQRNYGNRCLVHGDRDPSESRRPSSNFGGTIGDPLAIAS
jgi:hypothetical protein